MNNISTLEALSITMQVFGKILWTFGPFMLVAGVTMWIIERATR